MDNWHEQTLKREWLTKAIYHRSHSNDDADQGARPNLMTSWLLIGY